MNSVAQNKKKNKRYLPHEWTTRIYAVQLYRQTKDIGFVCRRYHISKASLMRWNKQYDEQRNRFGINLTALTVSIQTPTQRKN